LIKKNFTNLSAVNFLQFLIIKALDPELDLDPQKWKNSGSGSAFFKC
jgi:hypothetical protein